MRRLRLDRPRDCVLHRQAPSVPWPARGAPYRSEQGVTSLQDLARFEPGARRAPPPCREWHSSARLPVVPRSWPPSHLVSSQAPRRAPLFVRAALAPKTRFEALRRQACSRFPERAPCLLPVRRQGQEKNAARRPRDLSPPPLRRIVWLPASPGRWRQQPALPRKAHVVPASRQEGAMSRARHSRLGRRGPSGDKPAPKPL